MSQLANQLVIAEREEVSRGIRLLLATPLIHERVAPEEFDLVRRRHDPIRKWFDYYCGWALTVEPRLGYARLVKIRAAADPSRPARRLRSSRAPFDRRRYVLLCVLAAELLAVPVTTIGLLADRVSAGTAADDIVSTFDTSSRAERMASRRSAAAEHLGVSTGRRQHRGVRRVHRGQGLTRRRTLLLRMLAAPVGPSQLVCGAGGGARIDELLGAVSQERRTHDEQPVRPRPDVGVQRNLCGALGLPSPVDDRSSTSTTAADERAISLRRRPAVLRARRGAGGFERKRAEDTPVDVEAIATDSRFPDGRGQRQGRGAVAARLAVRARHPRAAGTRGGRSLERFPRWAKSYRGDAVRGTRGRAVAVLKGSGSSGMRTGSSGPSRRPPATP